MKQKCIALLAFLLFAGAGLSAAPPKVILAFPIENLSGNPSLGWMSEGLAELVGTRLSSSSRCVLERKERNEAYEQLGLPLGTSLSLASEYKVARLLGATVAVVGHFTLAGDQLTTQVQWLDVAKLALSSPVVVTGKLTELVPLETRLTWELLRAQPDQAAPETEEEFGNRFPPVRLAAFESYMRGILSSDLKTRINFLREADRLNPRDHRAAFALGEYYFDQEAYADSARWLQLLNSGDRDYAVSLFLMGVDEFSLGHSASAGAVLKRLSAMLPLGEVSNNLGAVEFRAGHYDKALEDFQQAFQADQTESDYAFNMSLAFWQLKKYQDASNYLHKVLAQDADDLEAHVLLSQVAGELGEAETRQTELDWVSEHNTDAADDPPEDHQAGRQSAPDPSPRIEKEYDAKAFHLLSFEIGRAAQASMEKVPAQEIPSAGQARLKRGMELLAAGSLFEAERELTQAVVLLPQDSGAHQALGETYEREGKHALAAAELQTSLKQKDSSAGHLWLAKTYVSLEHLEPALKQAQAAQQLEPTDAEAKDLAERIQAQLSGRRDKP
ncbi:MAG TPA: tetratricopeptide repeat protein [Terriglobia bacterium]|nr:tetratricopeptide repeat protein [Terriglobia bacterium]